MIQTDYPEDWVDTTPETFWDVKKLKKGKTSTGQGTYAVYTSAPYMGRYTKGGKLFADGEKSDWITDANVMAHFAVPDVRHSVTVKCYYTATVPVRVLVYERSDEGYSLRESPSTTYWQSQGTVFSDSGHLSVGGTDRISAAFVVSDKNTKIRPYTKTDSYRGSYPDAVAVKAISGCSYAKINGTLIQADVGYYPMYVIILVDRAESDVGYTLVRYVHLGTGEYIKTSDEYFALADTEHYEPHWKDVILPDGSLGKEPEHADDILNWTAKVFVSFQQYEEYDEGDQGLNGSIYELGDIVYNYKGPHNNRPVVTTQKPQGKPGANNDWYFLDEAGDETKNIKDVTKEKRNSLVVYAVYEDVFRGQFPGLNPNGGRIVDLTTTEDAFHWNWELMDRFVWDSAMDWDGSVADGNLSFDPSNFANSYFAKVFGTNASAVFQAQTAIPSSDYVRMTASVPRYLTRGYWVQHNLRTLYRILCAQAHQSRTKVEKVDGDQKIEDCDDVTMHEYWVYSYEEIRTGEVSIERAATFYTLGNAEVWDPERVTLENNTFSDSPCSKELLATLLPVNGESHALFAVTKAPANFSMPPLYTNWLFVNFGVVNSWEGGDSDRYNFSPDEWREKAETIVGQYSVCNDEVAFYDGLGNRYVLTTSTTGLVPSVAKPGVVPEAGFTEPGVFDSLNHVQAGVQLIPTINNGHHDTLSTAYYKQVYCYNSEYQTSELIKTIIVDDGDDDVEIFTPMANYSRLNLDYDNGETDADGVHIHPDHNFNQRSGESYGEGKHALVLDMEYTLTMDCSGFNSHFDGYGTQNYARYLEKDGDGDPYMQVMFPFPVQMDIRLADGGEESRYYIANTWISLKVPLSSGRKVYRFFIPSWAGETEKANIKFRGITINARENNPEFTMLQEPYNSGLVSDSLKTGKHLETKGERNYVAQTHEVDSVVGRLYGLQVIDISDYPKWQPVFREFDSGRGQYSPVLNGNAYHSGLNNQNGFLGRWGSIWTTPTVDGSHPTDSSAGTLGTGYKIRCRMESVGDYFTSLDGISIKPEFYYMNSKGEYLQEDGSWGKGASGRQEVSVYYNETVGGTKQTLVKVGSAEDRMNQKTLQLTSEDFGISEDVLEKTAESMGVSVEKLDVIREQFCFSDIKLTSDMRVYYGDKHVSYRKAKQGTSELNAEYEFNPAMYSQVGTDSALAEVLTKDEILKSVQQWYGEYYVPSETFVTTKGWDEISEEIQDGFDGSEDCWLDGGYLVINFQPVLTTGGQPRLNYNNSKVYQTPDGNLTETGCNMFVVENYAASKQDSNGRKLQFRDGDVVMYAIVNQRGSDPNDPDPGMPDDPGNEDDPYDPDDRNDGVPDGGGPGPAKDNYGSHGTH